MVAAKTIDTRSLAGGVPELVDREDVGDTGGHRITKPIVGEDDVCV